MINVWVSENGQTWAKNPAPQPTAHVISNKPHKQSETQFIHLKNRDDNSNYS